MEGSEPTTAAGNTAEELLKLEKFMEQEEREAQISYIGTFLTLICC